MSGANSAREALIVETLGEVAALIDRLEAVAPALDASRLALVSASKELGSQIGGIEHRMIALADGAKVQAIKHIARRTDEMARLTMEAQARAMEDAARALFRSELGPAIQQAAIPWQRLTELAQDSLRPWNRWLTHLATAMLASALSWALAAWLWLH